MEPRAGSDLEWSRSIAGIVVNFLEYPNLVAHTDFSQATAVAAEEIHRWLARKDYPAGYGFQGDMDLVDHAWVEKIATSLVGGLVSAGFVRPENADAALRVASEEIWIHLLIEDRPPQKD